jgi:hypothetical protein
MPGIRIDNELLVVSSVGVPIGLGIYWAWVHLDWSVRSRRVGLAAAAAGGALGGAWLVSTPRTDYSAFSRRSPELSLAPTSR